MTLGCPRDCQKLGMTLGNQRSWPYLVPSAMIVVLGGGGAITSWRYSTRCSLASSMCNVGIWFKPRAAAPASWLIFSDLDRCSRAPDDALLGDFGFVASIVAAQPHRARASTSAPFAQHHPLAEQCWCDVDKVKPIDVPGRSGVGEERHFSRDSSATAAAIATRRA